VGYWEVKEKLARLIPRQHLVASIEDPVSIRTGWRYENLRERKLSPAKWREFTPVEYPQDRIGNAAEVSRKAFTCPLPFNVDVWDGKVCPYDCIYCFANVFRNTLYGNFVQTNANRLRHHAWVHFKPELDRMMGKRRSPGSLSGPARAVALDIPMRIGVRFENFTKAEAKQGVALSLLRYLSEKQYPVIINTKSNLVARDDYLEALAGNKGGAMVQFSMLSADDSLLRSLEPGAPSATERFEAMRALNAAGVRATPRIEPFLPFLADREEDIRRYIESCHQSGVTHVCWDTFSYSACDFSTRRLFQLRGIDFDRVFLASSESRIIASYMMHLMMEHFRANGFKCSTYDETAGQFNDDVLCCNTTGALTGGANWGSTKGAIHFIRESKRPVSWAAYSLWVKSRGGFLSEDIESRLRMAWNNEGDGAYSLAWGPVETAGVQGHDLIWVYTGYNEALERARLFLEGL